MTDFRAFPREMRTFLEGLRANNTRTWFEAHRDEYERHWLAPAQAFVAAIGPSLEALAPAVRAEPRVNGSIMRINRDTRFSKDKRPYKDHLDLWFWEGAARRDAVSGFFLRLTPEVYAVGVGAHHFDPAGLRRFRKAVADAAAGPALARVVERVEKAGYEVYGQQYARRPAGYPGVIPEADRFLRFGALWTASEVHPSAVAEPGSAVEHAMAEYRRMVPIHRWLVDTLQDT
jgi:uncharacterized protein (TIGR02453 family)